MARLGNVSSVVKASAAIMDFMIAPPVQSRVANEIVRTGLIGPGRPNDASERYLTASGFVLQLAVRKTSRAEKLGPTRPHIAAM
jgi:hypothetical protein